MTAIKIFLSYASQDFDIVEKVYRKLVKAGHSVFLDKVSLTAGSWRSQLETEIRSREVFIIFLSKHTKQRFQERNGFVAQEYELAFQLASSLSPADFKIIPVRLDDEFRGDLSMNMYQQFDIFNDFETEVDSLISHLGNSSDKVRVLDEINSHIFSKDYLNAYAKLMTLERITGDSEKLNINKAVCLFNLDRKNDAVRLAETVLVDSQNIDYAKTLAAMIVGARDIAAAKRALEIEIFKRSSDTKSGTLDQEIKMLLGLLAPAGQELIRSECFGIVFYTDDVDPGGFDPWGISYTPPRRKPDAKPSFFVGKRIVRGDPIAWMFAMGSSIPIEAPFDCVLVEQLYEDGDSVDFDAPVALVTKFDRDF